MSEKFELVRKYYRQGLWDEARVRKSVGRWITAEEAELILGENQE